MNVISDPYQKTFAEINYGPWDRSTGYSFVHGYADRLPGVGFYPADMTRQEFCEEAAGFRKHQDAFSFRGIAFHPGAELRTVIAFQHEFRCAEDQRRPVIKGDGGLFPRGREGQDGPRLFRTGNQLLPQRVQRAAVFIKSTQQAAEAKRTRKIRY